MSFFNLTLKPLQAAKVLKPEDKQKPAVSNLNYHNLRQPITESQKSSRKDSFFDK